MPTCAARRDELPTFGVPHVLSVFDAVLPDAAAYRAKALRSTFGDVPTPAGVFKGIAVCDDPTVPAFLATQFPDLEVSLSFFRQSPRWQREPTWVHSDAAETDVTAILYLNPDPPVGDGTTFWFVDETGAMQGGPVDLETSHRANYWSQWHHVPAQLGRVIVFPANFYHSRGLRNNYGEGDSARLVQVCFLRKRETIA